MVRNGFVMIVVLIPAAAGLAAEPVASGPQAGEKVPGPFKPLNATGADAGKKECLYCKNGSRPVVMVFARDMSPGVVSLIKKLDAATAAKSEEGLAGCLILLSDMKDVAPALAKWADAGGIRNIVLATYPSPGPEKYRLAPDAAVTVLLYTKQTVKANHSFRAGELTQTGVDSVMADLSRILPRE